MHKVKWRDEGGTSYLPKKMKPLRRKHWPVRTRSVLDLRNNNYEYENWNRGIGFQKDEIEKGKELA